MPQILPVRTSSSPRWPSGRFRLTPGKLPALPLVPRIVGSLTLLLAALCGTLGAQQSGVLTGRVTDASTGEAIPSAQVLVKSSRLQTLTGPDGGFRIRGLPGGRHAIEIRAVGYAPRETSVEIGPGGTAPRSLEVSLDLALDVQPVPLPGVAATAASRSDPRLAGFWRRKERGLGHFFTREDLDMRAHGGLLEVLRRVPNARVVTTDAVGTGRYLTFGRHSRLQGSTLEGTCAAAVYLDGRPALMSDVGLDEFDPNQIEAVEVYTGPAGVPAQFNRTGTSRRDVAMDLERAKRLRHERETPHLPYNPVVLNDPSEIQRDRTDNNAVHGDARCGVVVLWSRLTAQH